MKHEIRLAMKRRLGRLVDKYDEFVKDLKDRRPDEWWILRKKAEQEFEASKRKRVKKYYDRKLEERALTLSSLGTFDGMAVEEIAMVLERHTVTKQKFGHKVDVCELAEQATNSTPYESFSKFSFLHLAENVRERGRQDSSRHEGVESPSRRLALIQRLG